jgi:hypothetical protein
MQPLNYGIQWGKEISKWFSGEDHLLTAINTTYLAYINVSNAYTTKTNNFNCSFNIGFLLDRTVWVARYLWFYNWTDSKDS